MATAYKGKEPYIFISYAHKNSNSVLPIIAKLESDGYRVWYDEGITPGSDWDENIAKRINDCACMIAMMSKEYMESDNCCDELNFARDKNKPRLLVYLSKVTLPMGMQMRLNRGQAIHKYSLASDEAFYKKLYEAEIIVPCKKKSASASNNILSAKVVIEAQKPAAAKKAEQAEPKPKAPPSDVIIPFKVEQAPSDTIPFPLTLNPEPKPNIVDSLQMPVITPLTPQSTLHPDIISPLTEQKARTDFVLPDISITPIRSVLDDLITPLPLTVTPPPSILPNGLTTASIESMLANERVNARQKPAFPEGVTVTTTTASGSLTYNGKKLVSCSEDAVSVVVQDGTTEIAERAFKGCLGLETVTLPASLNKIGAAAFEGCFNLKTLIFKGTSQKWQQLSKGEGWEPMIYKLKVEMSDGITTEYIKEGNYSLGVILRANQRTAEEYKKKHP